MIVNKHRLTKKFVEKSDTSYIFLLKISSRFSRCCYGYCPCSYSPLCILLFLLLIGALLAAIAGTIIALLVSNKNEITSKINN